MRRLLLCILLALTFSGMSILSCSQAVAMSCSEAWKTSKDDFLEICKQEALQGGLYAQERLDCAYFYGTGTEEDSPEGFKRKSFRRTDFSDAFRWAKMAEAQGSTQILDILYEAYHRGLKSKGMSPVEALTHKRVEGIDGVDTTEAIK